MSEIVILSDADFYAVVQIMRQPHISSPALVRGAELLRELNKARSKDTGV